MVEFIDKFKNELLKNIFKINIDKITADAQLVAHLLKNQIFFHKKLKLKYTENTNFNNKLLTYLELNTQIEILQISSAWLRAENIDALKHMLIKNRSIKTLIIYFENKDDIYLLKFFPIIFDELRSNNKNLNTLSLYNCGLVYSEENFLKVFEKINPIQHLHLNFNNLTGIKFQTNLPIIKIETEVLNRIINQNNLISFSLNGANIGNNGAQEIFNNLPKKLNYLSLAGNNITSVTTGLSALLSNNTTLETIDLSYNEINTRDAEIIANSLKNNRTIKNLYLHYNNINEVGIVRLMKAIKNYAAINCLYLNSALIQHDIISTHAIVKVLATHCSLKILQLSYSDQDSLLKLFEVLSTNNILKELIAIPNSNSNWTVESFEKAYKILLQLLEKNTAIINVYWCDTEKKINELYKQDTENYENIQEIFHNIKKVLFRNKSIDWIMKKPEKSNGYKLIKGLLTHGILGYSFPRFTNSNMKKCFTFFNADEKNLNQKQINKILDDIRCFIAVLHKAYPYQPLLEKLQKQKNNINAKILLGVIDLLVPEVDVNSITNEISNNRPKNFSSIIIDIINGSNINTSSLAKYTLTQCVKYLSSTQQAIVESSFKVINKIHEESLKHIAIQPMEDIDENKQEINQNLDKKRKIDKLVNKENSGDIKNRRLAM